MDNKSIAGILYETADLMEINGDDPFRIRSYQVCDLAGVEKLAREGKLQELPRMGEKQEKKILKSIEDYRRIAGRFCLDDADKIAQNMVEHLAGLPGVDKITPAGSLRRGRATVGDLDIV